MNHYFDAMTTKSLLEEWQYLCTLVLIGLGTKDEIAQAEKDIVKIEAVIVRRYDEVLFPEESRGIGDS